VYFAIGRRPPPAVTAGVSRIDPAATTESHSGHNSRFRGETSAFDISWETSLTYADGRTRMIKVAIKVNKTDGHSYVVTAGEAESTQDQSRLQLSSGVHLQASDGFEMTADRATYTKADGLIHSDVPVTFSKGRMRGSGTNVDYHETSEVLSVAQDARVTTLDEHGTATLDFTAGTAVLDRFNDILTLDSRVHVLRDMQTMDADRATAHLAPKEEFVTFIEMRGNSRVQGGGGTLDAMSARDIDLDYTDDGKLLERVLLNGAAGLTMVGANGAAGRQLTAESVEVKLAPDGTVTSATGRENARMVLPAAEGAPARTVRGRTLDAAGAPGAGLTEAHFVDAVEYREEAAGASGGRTVHSQRLDLKLSAEAVTAAAFTGEVTFEEPAFRAQAAAAAYDPVGGTLHLEGGDRRGQPCVADDRIAVDARTIDVTVESRRLKAMGAVKTQLRPGGTQASANSPCATALRAAARSIPAAAAARDDDSRLPGLLQPDQIVNATAEGLEYGGTGQSLVFTGNASLFQGSATTMRGDRILVAQETGDLVVTGKARFSQAGSQDVDRTDARAEEIRYTDSTRQIDYLNAPAGSSKPGSGTVRVDGPQGNLEANKIEVFLRKEGGRIDRLEAYQRVTAKIDDNKKTVTADRLTYLAAEDQYDMRGADGGSVKVVEACKETIGKALTFKRADTSITVRGNGELRVQARNVAGCQPPPSSR
jgi:lipopolysaccharide export system protein LptA